MAAALLRRPAARGLVQQASRLGNVRPALGTLGRGLRGPAQPRRSLSFPAQPATLKIWDSRSQQLLPFEPKPHPAEHPTTQEGLGAPEGFLGPWMAGLPAVSWYMCGPTVYDQSHIGHARTYVCFDIIRRIMTELAGYHVVVAMGMTDIDDKIIRRANELGVPFHKLSQQFERSFKEDMRQLNVLPPNTYLRVSDRVQAIVDYIETLVERGYAYSPEATPGDVYFDTQAFQASGKHKYGRLARSEQDTSADRVSQEGIRSEIKKHSADFALWKSAKPNEPFWESPWGPGRPGWHIECSAAASGVFGPLLHIHSGGIDLQFPHHNNEIAQTEAFYDQPAWTQYWLHTGHLHIQGCKMSKSLKNFITIQQFLSEHSPHTFRMLCLTAGYRSNLDFTDDRVEESRQILESFRHFIGSVDFRAELARDELDWIAGDANWTAAETDLQRQIIQTDFVVRTACLEDFDTPKAIIALRGLVSAGHAYMKSSPPEECANRGQQLLEQAASLIQRYLCMFGFPAATIRPGLGGGEGAEVSRGLAGGWVEMRGRVRDQALAALKQLKKSSEQPEVVAKALAQGILEECDRSRDVEMARWGLKINDAGKGRTQWDLVPIAGSKQPEDVLDGLESTESAENAEGGSRQ